MKFAFLNKQNMLYFFPFDEQESSSLTVPAVESGRYIFTEQQNALLGAGDLLPGSRQSCK
ncbi:MULTISPECIES: hypothetical protein [unclassified Pseudomonas]|uniref:hypothetical protein n=1 Tax=unclassified Pseudomonas TaxID=196821 RepID=UPI0011AF03DD|nr:MULTISPECIES: hypothetical protein [unclassified Pseudomonas]